MGNEAFRKVIDQQVTPAQGAIVANIIPDDDAKQSACIDLLKRKGIETPELTRAYARKVLDSDLLKTRTVDLFGEQVDYESIVHEKLQILSGAKKELSRRRKLFASLVENEGYIESIGRNVLNGVANRTQAERLKEAEGLFREPVLDTAANKRVRSEMGRAIALSRKLANRKSKLGTLANELALKVKKEEMPLEKAVKDFVDFILEHNTYNELN